LQTTCTSVDVTYNWLLARGFRDPVVPFEHCTSPVRISSSPRRVIGAAAKPLSNETNLFRLFCNCLLCTLKPPPRLVAMSSRAPSGILVLTLVHSHFRVSRSSLMHPPRPTPESRYASFVLAGIPCGKRRRRDGPHLCWQANLSVCPDR